MSLRPPSPELTDQNDVLGRFVLSTGMGSL